MKFEISAVIFFSVKLKTDTPTDQSLKILFSDQGPSKCVYPSKSPFRKFDPKTLLSLLYIGKRKQ